MDVHPTTVWEVTWGPHWGFRMASDRKPTPQEAEAVYRKTNTWADPDKPAPQATVRAVDSIWVVTS